MGRKRIHDLSSYKFSLTIENENKSILDILTENYSLKYGPMINFILKTVFQISDSTRKAIIDNLCKRILEIDVSLAAATGYEYQALRIEREEIYSFVKLINKGIDISLPSDSSGMQKIMLKNGVLLIPEDWILVNPEDAEQCMYCAVIECKHWKEFQIPHFAMLTNYRYPCHYTDDFMDEFKHKCINYWPAFQEKVLDKQVILQQDPTGQTLYLNTDKFMSAPTIGFFDVKTDDDPYFKLPGTTAPYHAIIVTTDAVLSANK